MEKFVLGLLAYVLFSCIVGLLIGPRIETPDDHELTEMPHV